MRNQIEILLWPTDLPAGAQTIPTSQIEKLRDKETNEHFSEMKPGFITRLSNSL